MHFKHAVRCPLGTAAPTRVFVDAIGLPGTHIRWASSRVHFPEQPPHQVGVRHESKLEVYNSEWCRLRVGRNLGRIRWAKHATRGSDVKHTEILSTTSQSSRCTIWNGAASA